MVITIIKGEYFIYVTLSEFKPTLIEIYIGIAFAYMCLLFLYCAIMTIKYASESYDVKTR